MKLRRTPDSATLIQLLLNTQTPPPSGGVRRGRKRMWNKWPEGMTGACVGHVGGDLPPRSFLGVNVLLNYNIYSDNI